MTELSDDQIATAAARQAAAVHGVLRLQPGLKHAVGRAARALFATGGEHDQLAAAASGVEVTHADPASNDGEPASNDGGPASNSTAGRPATQITIRLITATEPSPRAIAHAVQTAVGDQLTRLTGAPVRVIVVIVDVEDVDDMAGTAQPMSGI